MFVRSINIQGFRGINNCKEIIKLSNFTVIIGRNNSGKSAILEALSLLPHPELSDIISRTKKIRYLRELHHDGILKKLLYLYAGTARLEYIINYNNADRRIKIEFDQDNIECNFEGSGNAGIKYAQSRLNMNQKYLEQSVVFIPDTTNILVALEARMNYYKELIMKEGHHIYLAEFLNKFVNDEYSELVFLTPISLRKILKDNKVYLPINDLGSGAEKVIKVMALLKVISPKLVIIDDFESGFHPSLMNLFLEWLKNEKWQTIISTHSIDVLNRLVDINPEQAKIIKLNKSKDDVLSHESLTLEELEDILNANIDPRKLGDALGL